MGTARQSGPSRRSPALPPPPWRAGLRNRRRRPRRPDRRRRPPGPPARSGPRGPDRGLADHLTADGAATRWRAAQAATIYQEGMSEPGDTIRAEDEPSWAEVVRHAEQGEPRGAPRANEPV